jgi:hypothetical protein
VSSAREPFGGRDGLPASLPPPSDLADAAASTSLLATLRRAQYRVAALVLLAVGASLTIAALMALRSGYADIDRELLHRLQQDRARFFASIREH